MAGYRKIGNLLITKEEEEQLFYIAPSEYIDLTFKKNIDDVKDGYLIGFFQKELGECLHSFLNGGLSTVGYVAYPLMQPVSNEIKEKLSRLSKISDVLNKRGEKISSVKQPKILSEYANSIGQWYHDIENIREVGTRKIKKSFCDELDVEMYAKENAAYVSPLLDVKKIAKSMGNDLTGMYLHGSLATNDFVKGWSDCDTLCVVSKKAIQDKRRLLSVRSKLMEMRKFFYRIDPLQHHGSMVMSEYDLDSYPQSSFPLPLFSYAKSFGEDRIDKVKVRQESREEMTKLFWMVCFFRRMHEENRYSMGSYEMKNFLHLMALFPSLYLQAKGIYVYKKFSFEMAKKDFSEELWQPIDEMTSIRNRWVHMPTYPLIERYAQINPFVAYQMNARLIDMNGPIHKLKIDIRKLVDGMHNLSEKAWRKVMP